jgi:hypothetical protein
LGIDVFAFLEEGAFVTEVVVGVDILAEKGDFPDTLVSQKLNFIFYRTGGSTSFPASGEGNNAKTTHVVTASHNRNPSMQLVLVFPNWDDVCVCLIE